MLVHNRYVNWRRLATAWTVGHSQENYDWLQTVFATPWGWVYLSQTRIKFKSKRRVFLNNGHIQAILIKGGFFLRAWQLSNCLDFLLWLPEKRLACKRCLQPNSLQNSSFLEERGSKIGRSHFNENQCYRDTTVERA